MWETLFQYLRLLVSDITIPTSVNVSNTTTKTSATVGENSTDIKCKIVEIRNTSTTLGIRVYVGNVTDYVTLVALERRIFMVKQLSDLKVTLDSGETSTRVEFVIEP